MSCICAVFKYAFVVTAFVDNVLMKSLTLVAIALFFIAFIGVYFYNSGQAANNLPGFEFKPPYAFVPGDTISAFNAFFFVFIVSLLLFGAVSSKAARHLAAGEPLVWFWRFAG